MRFGVREICNVVLRAKATQTLGNRKFYKGEPVLYFDTLKTSSLEGAATTVYATGGRGNSRLVAWEGERTLTFTMEDALISPEGFSILSGAGLIPVNADQPIYVHTTSQVEVESASTIKLPELPCWNGFEDGTANPQYNANADIFVMVMEDGEIVDEPCIPAAVNGDTLTCYGHHGGIPAGTIVLVDYYVKRTGGAQVIEITADKFGGNYYLEADTLFRRESDGVDMPAEFIIPNCKVQSNFTFTMASSGDPSTFTFTMDAFPDYTRFDRTHKVLATIQMISDETGEEDAHREACHPAGMLDYATGKVADYGNKAVSDLYGSDVAIDWNGTKGTVTGTFKKIIKWDELPKEPKPSEEEPMYFYIMQLDESYLGKPFKFYKNNEVKGTTLAAGKDELLWVLDITNREPVKFTTGSAPETIICELDFTKATYEDEE